MPKMKRKLVVEAPMTQAVASAAATINIVAHGDATTFEDLKFVSLVSWE